MWRGGRVVGQRMSQQPWLLPRARLSSCLLLHRSDQCNFPAPRKEKAVLGHTSLSQLSLPAHHLCRCRNGLTFNRNMTRPPYCDFTAALKHILHMHFLPKLLSWKEAFRSLYSPSPQKQPCPRAGGRAERVGQLPGMPGCLQSSPLCRL